MQNERPETIHIGQVGVGYWGRNLLRNLLSVPGVDVTACDRQPEILNAVKQQHPALSTTVRYEDLLEDERIQGIVIATRTPQHFTMAEAALRAGKHVFVEKPMARTVREAEQLVDLADRLDRRLMVGHLLLYHPAFRYVEALIRRGELGDVYYLHAMRLNLGIIRQRENAFESLAPHDLAVALWFFGGLKPVAVSAQGQAYLQEGVEDVVFATVYFEKGRLAHLHTSWLDPHKVRRLTVVGSKKMAVIDDVENTEKVRLYDRGTNVRPDEGRYVDYAEAMTVRTGDIHVPQITMQEPLHLECAHFIECIRTGQTPRSDGRDGLQVVRLLEAAKQSLTRNGAKVCLLPDP